MLATLIHFLTPHYQSLKNRTVFLLICAVSFFVRLPFFFRDYIDRDESTFILMGQSWADGNLPYTELWDLKPPIAFLFFAVIIKIIGKSFLAIRIFGALTVATTAFLTYKIALRVTTKKVAFWVALSCVALISMFGSLQGVMSEHICMLFFTCGLYMLLQEKNASWYFLSGLFMGLSVMTKLNMAYVILVLGLFTLFIHFRKKEIASGFLKSILFGCGVLLIIVLTFFPYYLEGIGEVWWESVVLASLEYADSRRSPLLKFLPITLGLLLFFFLGWKYKLLDFKKITTQILSVTVLAILYTFIKGGRINGHYLIQLHPIFIILFGVFLSNISYLKKINYRPYLFFILLLLPAESYLEYYRIIKYKIERGTFYNGEGITAPKYIREHNISTKNILFLGYHIGYWSLDAKPPTKSATHPSNICRNEIFPFIDNQRETAIEELTFIMEEVRPATVVIRKNRSIFDPKLIEENKYINTQLKEHYGAPITVDLAEIYVRSH